VLSLPQQEVINTWLVIIGLSVSHLLVFAFLFFNWFFKFSRFSRNIWLYSKSHFKLSYSFLNGGSLLLTMPILLYITALITCYTAKLFYQSFMYDFSGPLVNMSPKGAHGGKYFINCGHDYSSFRCYVKVWVGTSLLSGILLFIPLGVKTLPFGLVIAGALSATTLLEVVITLFITFSATRWGFDQLYAHSRKHGWVGSYFLGRR
jgi:hypothetical protein